MQVFHSQSTSKLDVVPPSTQAMDSRLHGLTDSQIYGFTDSRTCWINGFLDLRTYRVTDLRIHGQIPRCTDTRIHGVTDLRILDSPTHDFSDVRITDSWIHRFTDSQKHGLVAL